MADPDAYISIHDLTRRSTYRRSFPLSGRCYFNSRPHKEVDRKRSLSGPGKNYFNSRPHKEVDQIVRFYLIIQIYFNSRPHKEVDSKNVQLFLIFIVIIHYFIQTISDLFYILKIFCLFPLFLLYFFGANLLRSSVYFTSALKN